MKIMTFNTQHCQNFKEQKIDFDIMASAIKNCGAEIVGLNEMRSKGENAEYENQTEKLSNLTGLENYYFAKAIDVDGVNPYGNAILSKYPFKSVETILIPDPEPREGKDYETRCILKATLENGLTVIITHFGLTPEEHKNAVETVMKHIAAEKCILMGDFNVTPDDEVLNPIRKCLKDAADSFSHSMLSFPSDEPERKIDYIFVSEDIGVKNADIPPIVASDHRPHTAEIEF